MSLIKREPLNEIERLFTGTGLSLPKLGWDMAVDVFEDKGTVVAKMSVPGVDTDDIEISLERDTLMISGTRQEERRIEEKDYYSKEIRRGSFSRIVPLPKSVDVHKAQADYADGVITISMPVLPTDKKAAVSVRLARKEKKQH